MTVTKFYDQSIPMIKQIETLPTLNQQLLNKIVRELTQSLLKPALEFDEIMIENLMYPRKHHSLFYKIMHAENISQDCEGMGYKYSVQDMGNSQLLELIHIRKNIQEFFNQLKSISKDNFIDEITTSLKVLESLFYCLLKNLSAYIEVPSCSALYKPFLTDALPYFDQFFDSVKTLGIIIAKLVKTATLTGHNPSKYFQVEVTLSNMITTFSATNDTWYESMLVKSNSFDDFLEIRCQELKPRTIVRSDEFTTFHNKRKEKLRIVHRTL